jgi:hypothetical protein
VPGERRQPGSVDARADEHAVPGERRQPGSVVIRRGSVDARADEHAVPGRAPSAGIRQAITEHLALLAEAGGVVAEPGERRRIGYRLDSTPTTVAQQFLAALARGWEVSLPARPLRRRSRVARRPADPATPDKRPPGAGRPVNSAGRGTPA